MTLAFYWFPIGWGGTFFGVYINGQIKAITCECGDPFP
jgi:hypothetical protein